jgi:hypothetical protein
VKRPADSKIPYRSQGFGRFWDKNGYPCQAPPWGTLTAIDLNTGEFRWQSRLGEFEELTRRGVPKTGAPNLGGSIVTAGGLVFIGATNDSKFRAFDKETGEEIWTTDLPASGHATPMTFLGPKSGRQFVVISAGGGNKYNTRFTGKLMAFALPREGDAAEPRVISAVKKPVFRAEYKGMDETLPAAVARQPVPFSHRIHAGSRIGCQSCHPGATTAARAGLPDAAKCRQCHPSMKKDVSAIEWVRVYRVPDFVSFSHQKHAGAHCSTCHGPVESRDVLMKEVSTGMVACMDCHRQKKASVACNVCHELGQ